MVLQHGSMPSSRCGHPAAWQASRLEPTAAPSAACRHSAVAALQALRASLTGLPMDWYASPDPCAIPWTGAHRGMPRLFAPAAFHLRAGAFAHAYAFRS